LKNLKIINKLINTGIPKVKDKRFILIYKK
jgi:hypothetical protein